jgi:small GTP-binding protein
MFSRDRVPTKGVDYSKQTIKWDARTTVTLQFWDVAGQERLGTQTRIFFRGAHAAFVVYDVTNVQSIAAVPLWKQLLDDNVHTYGTAQCIPTILLANKIDLVTEDSESFDSTELNKLTEQCHFSCGISVTACGNYNVAQSVKKLVSLLLIKQEEIETEARLLGEAPDAQVILLDGDLGPPPSRCRC